jgi:hypothetical protein
LKRDRENRNQEEAILVKAKSIASSKFIFCPSAHAFEKSRTSMAPRIPGYYRNSDRELYYSLNVAKTDEVAAVMSYTIAYTAGFLGSNGEIKDKTISKCEASKVIRL